MSADPKPSYVTTSLEKLLTMLAKECLMRKPDDVEHFCLELLAEREGVLLAPIVNLKRGMSLADEDLRDIAADIDTDNLVSDMGQRDVEPRERAYHSSDDSEEEVKSVNSYHSNISRFEPVCDLTPSDEEDAGRVKTAAPHEGSPRHDLEDHAPVCYLFSTEVISDEELERKTKQYQGDDRMKSLFRAWDGDDSGTVDFVELVLALHKFEQVAHAGIDIQVASDALVQFVASDSERELKLREFTRVIILFALNNFEKDFDEVADHMLAVATSTSETAVLSARSGVDTSALEAADKAEEEFLRETVKGIEEHVTDNIRKIRTKRVAFRQSASRLPTLE